MCQEGFAKKKSIKIVDEMNLNLLILFFPNAPCKKPTLDK